MGAFHLFLNCINGIESRKASPIFTKRSGIFIVLYAMLTIKREDPLLTIRETYQYCLVVRDCPQIYFLTVNLSKLTNFYTN